MEVNFKDLKSNYETYNKDATTNRIAFCTLYVYLIVRLRELI